MMPLNLKSEYKSFGGRVGFYTHKSTSCNSEMHFAVYEPPQIKSHAVPILYFLSGLTCTEENFIIKAGAQKYAAKHGLMLVVPDTSPRNTGIKGEDNDYDLGTGAGFYVDATEAPWSDYYQMYSYVVEELPRVITENFSVNPDKQSIFGHSMGGHGALVCAIRNPNKYKSVSAFAPITAPMQSPWGQKVLSHYLGDDKEVWREYDANELVKHGVFHGSILIDQGTADNFMSEQLMPSVFEETCAEVKQPLILRYQKGYDHSYYFIASFMEDHIQHHASFLM
ncbi:MAG: S-formylglutathione hydrolase [Cyanobacteria bacterium P01_A01_bin.84]